MIVIRLLLEDLIRKQSRLHRALALFFLLFTLFDIAFPENCAEEFQQVNNINSTFVEVYSADTGNIYKSDNQSISIKATIKTSYQEKDNPNSDKKDEDCCFSCCSHWLPTKVPCINTIITILTLEKLPEIFLPESPLRKTYRPPRAI